MIKKNTDGKIFWHLLTGEEKNVLIQEQEWLNTKYEKNHIVFCRPDWCSMGGEDNTFTGHAITDCWSLNIGKIKKRTDCLFCECCKGYNLSEMNWLYIRQNIEKVESNDKIVIN